VRLLAAVTRQWHRRNPEVAITLRESTATDEALGLVDSDDVDVAVPTAPSAGRFTDTAVAEEQIVLAAPAGHPPATRRLNSRLYVSRTLKACRPFTSHRTTAPAPGSTSPSHAPESTTGISSGSSGT